MRLISGVVVSPLVRSLYSRIWGVALRSSMMGEQNQGFAAGISTARPSLHVARQYAKIMIWVSN